MAAWRPFGPLRYPTWWVSEMTIDVRGREIRYRHVRGITRGMNVVWRFAQADQGVTATIVHEWRGPAWPLIGPLAAGPRIGPAVIPGIAPRPPAGVKRFAERRPSANPAGGASS